MLDPFRDSRTFRERRVRGPPDCPNIGERLRFPNRKDWQDGIRAGRKPGSSAMIASRRGRPHRLDIRRSDGYPPFRRPSGGSKERSVATAEQNRAGPRGRNRGRIDDQAVNRQNDFAPGQNRHVGGGCRHGCIRPEPDIRQGARRIGDHDRIPPARQTRICGDTAHRYTYCTGWAEWTYGT